MSKTKQQRMAARRQEAARVTDAAAPVQDGFRNEAARLGLRTGNLSDDSRYGLNPITRKRVDLEYMYRGAWIAQVAVDALADDMTRAGVDLSSTILPPDEVDELTGSFEHLQLWQGLGNVVRWSRLYGGAIGVIMIDGQDFTTPLRLDSITKGSFKGILPLDRWLINPTFMKLVEELGPDLGKPEIYQIGINAPALRGQMVHYSRVIRMEGKDLPYMQKIAEQGWGMSVIEPVYDRMVAFDSATTAMAQLVYKSHLRTMYIEGLDKILAAGGPGLAALTSNMDTLRAFQSTEGLSLVDAKNKLETNVYAFTGLADVIISLGQQISGNLQIPMVRLFGQSPVGMNATGESDLRTYYDKAAGEQETKLRVPVARLIDIDYRSTFGRPIPAGFKFKFNPLWLLREPERAAIASQVTTAVLSAHEQNVVSRATALKELRKSSEQTGVWDSITDADIAEAKDDPPAPVLGPENVTAESKIVAAGAKEEEAAKDRPAGDDPAPEALKAA